MRFGLSAPLGHDKCTPGPQTDPLGLHHLGCRNAAGARTQRHDGLLDTLLKTASAADPNAFQIAREERLAEAENSKARPGDIALNLGDGRSLVDVTVVSPFSSACQTINRTAGFWAAAAELAYDSKIAKWRRLLKDHQLD